YVYSPARHLHSFPTRRSSDLYLVGTSVDPSGWKNVINPANASTEASAGGRILFDRPEDFDEANGRIYFTATEPGADAALRTGARSEEHTSELQSLTNLVCRLL